MTRGRVNIIKKQKRLVIILTVICLLIVVNGICYQSVWGKSYQEENYQGVLEIAQWEPDEEHSEAIPELTPEPTPTPNVGNGSNNPIVSAPTPKPIPTPTMELIPTIVPAPTETVASNHDDDLSSDQGTDNQGTDNQGAEDQVTDNQGIDNQGIDNQVTGNQNEQITRVKVVPVNMGRMFLVSIIAMVGLKLILFVGKRR